MPARPRAAPANDDRGGGGKRAGDPDYRTMFINVQHPGENTTVWGAPTPENPRAVSNWPDFDPAGRPRAATVSSASATTA
jgi:secreted PhoX family phosphatase